MVLSQGPPLISPLHLLGLVAGASNAVGNVKSPVALLPCLWEQDYYYFFFLVESLTRAGPGWVEPGFLCSGVGGWGLGT